MQYSLDAKHIFGIPLKRRGRGPRWGNPFWSWVQSPSYGNAPNEPNDQLLTIDCDRKTHSLAFRITFFFSGMWERKHLLFWSFFLLRQSTPPLSCSPFNPHLLTP
ncbi:unnamed protein product, partial [Choristocarpus tenellus]